MKISTRRRDAWLRHPFGARLLATERALMDAVLHNLFGYYLIQVGGWGRAAYLCDASRIRHQYIVDDRGNDADLFADPDAWPIASDSVDVVVLPHTLELTADPHAVLREAERVLIGEGHLVVLGFSPWSLWRFFRPGKGRLVSEWRLKDWLALLGFDVVQVRRHSPKWLGGAYVLLAKKKVAGMTLVGPKVKAKARGSAIPVGAGM